MQVFHSIESMPTNEAPAARVSRESSSSGAAHDQKSVIVKWRQRKRRAKAFIISTYLIPNILSLVFFFFFVVVVVVVLKAQIVKSTSSRIEAAPNPFEDSLGSLDSFSQTTFSLGSAAQDNDGQDSELGRTLSAPLSSPPSSSTQHSGDSSASKSSPQQKSVTGSGRSFDAVESGDHFQPNESFASEQSARNQQQPQQQQATSGSKDTQKQATEADGQRAAAPTAPKGGGGGGQWASLAAIESHLQRVEFGDHAEPSELGHQLATSGSSPMPTNSSNMSSSLMPAGDAQAEDINNNLLNNGQSDKDKESTPGQLFNFVAADSNRTSALADAPDNAAFSAAAATTTTTTTTSGNNQTNQQVGTLETHGTQQAETTTIKSTYDGNEMQKQRQKKQRDGSKSKKRKRKRKKNSGKQTSQNSTTNADVGSNSDGSSSHQMITYVSSQQQQHQQPQQPQTQLQVGAETQSMPPAAYDYHFDRLLGSSQPLMARFLQPSAFRLALNSPVYKQFQQFDGSGSTAVAVSTAVGQQQQQQQQQPQLQQLPLEFGRYFLDTSSGRVVPKAGAPPRGPFELEQLQATASMRQNKKSLNGVGGGGGGGDQQLQAHESSKLEVNPELAPTAGPSPAIADDNQLTGGSGDGDDETALNSNTLGDYDLDDDGGGADDFLPEQQQQQRGLPRSRDQSRDGGGGGGGSLHDKSLSDFPSSLTSLHETSNNKKQTDPSLLLSDSPTNNKTTAAYYSSGEGTHSHKQHGSAAKQAQESQQVALATSARKNTGLAQTQSSSSRSNGLSIGSNELLVGPFKSEADAPATITLAGVVYQKSGTSSAVLRATKPSGVGGGSASTSSTSSSTNTGLANKVFTLESSATSGSVPATGVDASRTYLDDWPSSLLQALKSQQLSSAASPSSSSSSSSSSSFSAPNLGSSNIYLGSVTSTSGAADNQLQSFVQLPSSTTTTSAALAAGGALPLDSEQLSLSSSSAKPTTTKSLNGHLSSAGSAAARGAVPSAPQLYQQRLPNGNIIWTLSKPVLTNMQSAQQQQQQQQQPQPHLSSLNSLIQAAASNDPLVSSILPASASTSSAAVSSGASTFELGTAAASSEPSESKQHGEHKSGPIVIVQKDVKPVKYHLLRAYLKLRRLLRPYEATYVFPNERTTATTSAEGTGGVVGGAMTQNAFVRRRQLASPLNLLTAAAAAAANSQQKRDQQPTWASFRPLGIAKRAKGSLALTSLGKTRTPVSTTGRLERK